MISIIIPEHNEPSHIVPMLNQIEKSVAPHFDLEVVIVTSDPGALAFQNQFTFDIKTVIDIHGSGIARNRGVAESSGDSLLFMDSHCCFDNLVPLFDLLNERPDAIIAPGIQPVSFPECVPDGSGIGYGCFFTPSFDWHWISKESESPFTVPFCSACFMLMKRQTFDDSIIGFIPVEGVGFDEEICMRLHRLGHPTIIQPECTVGHVFKKSYPQESTVGYVPSRAIALMLSVFDEALFAEIYRVNSERWGDIWSKALNVAHRDFNGLRETLKSQAKPIEERWFFRNYF